MSLPFDEGVVPGPKVPGMRVYVASSFRNERCAGVVDALRAAGHLVYDFRDPLGNGETFSWREVDPGWEAWDVGEYRNALHSRPADAAFALDMVALEKADACVLVLPCGRSAYLEMGYAVGRCKRTVVLLGGEKLVPELMYRMIDARAETVEQVVEFLSGGVGDDARRLFR